MSCMTSKRFQHKSMGIKAENNGTARLSGQNTCIAARVKCAIMCVLIQPLNLHQGF